MEKKKGAMLAIHQLYDSVRKLGEKDVLAILKHYAKNSEVIDVIERTEFLDLKRLASTVLWLTSSLELRVSGISLVEDLETGEPQFIEVYIDDCGWDEWKILSRAVKKQLISEGFDDVAGRVALVCKQALKTQRG